MEIATREVFDNVAPWMRVAFYGMMTVSGAILAAQIVRRARLWRRGYPGGFERDWKLWLRRLLVYALAQKKVHRKSLGALLHILLFSGFVVLTIGTTLLMIADYGPVHFHRGWYYLWYELTMEVFGLALCSGCVLALWRRMLRRPAALGHNYRDWLLIGALLAVGLTGFGVEALRLHYSRVAPDIARWSVIGYALNEVALQQIDLSAARHLHLALWWIHAVFVALFIALIPVTRFLHVLTGPVNIAMRPARVMGALAPVKIEDVQRTGRTGVAEIGDFSRQQLLSLDACMECGRCEEACPAWASGKPLSPKGVVVDLRNAMSAPSRIQLHGGVISAETLWACTMCQACVQACPVMIGQVDLISDLRRHLVGEGAIAGPPARALSNIGRHFNPYGRPATERMAWAAGLQVPTVTENPNCEYLLWLGCAVTFDPRAQKVARSLVQLLHEAKVSFAVLGKDERCTGDPARRIGDELVFQELARANVSTLNSNSRKKIVTPCPHCLNTIRNEYAQFDGHYQVEHHSELLANLIETGRLDRRRRVSETVTFHDPCYLARVNGQTEAPREVIFHATGNKPAEMTHHGSSTLCCGAGGGRMWFDEPSAQRVSLRRASEAASTGAKTLVTSCPFCLNMMTDATASAGSAGALNVVDIAELLIGNPTPPTSP